MPDILTYGLIFVLFFAFLTLTFLMMRKLNKNITHFHLANTILMEQIDIIKAKIVLGDGNMPKHLDKTPPEVEEKRKETAKNVIETTIVFLKIHIKDLETTIQRLEKMLNSEENV